MQGERGALSCVHRAGNLLTLTNAGGMNSLILGLFDLRVRQEE